MYNAEKNLALLSLARDGDGDALAELCENNIGLVRTVALSFRDRGTEYDDLVQIGTIGLIKAIRGYDPSFGTVFSTYAVPLIMGEIKKFLRDDGPVKVSRQIKRDAHLLSLRRDSFISQNAREPTVRELTAICDLPQESVLAALDIASPMLSFDAEYGDTTLENLVGTDNIESVIEHMSLHQAIRALEPEERRIIVLRYFRSLTQTDVAALLGVSQVRISRREKKAIEHLRELICR